MAIAHDLESAHLHVPLHLLVLRPDFDNVPFVPPLPDILADLLGDSPDACADSRLKPVA